MIINEVQNFGATIRKYRKSQGVTQCQLAALAGVSPRFVGELERGKPTTEIGRAFRVAWVLGLTIEIKGEEGI
ncbi:MAG: helix-turn-helix transcriptional regulator [Akkermansiaceae bacterium]|nr:helix-turn-helix transcriptional regulator [Akkermansiaceae bacterium]